MGDGTCELCQGPTIGSQLCRRCIQTKPRTPAGWERAKRERPALRTQRALQEHLARLDAKYKPLRPRTEGGAA